MDTQFELGDFYVTTLTARDPRVENKRNANIPVVPAFIVIHHRKFAWDHDLALKVMTSMVPELRSKHFVSSSDDEFTNLLVKWFPKATIVKDENHMVKKIGRAVERRGGNRKDRKFMKEEYRDLIRCTPEKYHSTENTQHY